MAARGAGITAGLDVIVHDYGAGGPFEQQHGWTSRWVRKDIDVRYSVWSVEEHSLGVWEGKFAGVTCPRHPVCVGRITRHSVRVGLNRHGKRIVKDATKLFGRGKSLMSEIGHDGFSN
jgi:hypothetical protein